jgi:hypothetical protein
MSRTGQKNVVQQLGFSTTQFTAQFSAGLPDGIFAKKSQFWYILERVGTENDGSILWSFGTFGYGVYFMSLGYFYNYFVYFLPFWYIVPRKIWQPWFSVSILT